MNVTTLARERIVEIADKAALSGFAGLRKVSANISPEAKVDVDPPDILGTRTDAFIAKGSLYLTHGQAVYSVGLLADLPELQGVSVFEMKAPDDPQFTPGSSNSRIKGHGMPVTAAEL